VYSIFFTNRNTQIVRVYSNYDVPGFDPFENATEQPLAGAVVTVTGPRGTYSFRDTLLPRTDTTRYKTLVPAYVGNWQPEPGQTYKLSVRSSGAGSTSATVTMLGKALKMYWYLPTDFLDYPDSLKYESSISAMAQFPSQDNPYFIQLTIEYAVLVNSAWRVEEIEVPLWTSDTTFKYASYPSLQITNRWGAGGYYDKWAYRRALTRVSGRYRDTELNFTRVVFRILQLDQNWYNYYKTVRTSQDPLTIRLDQPDFTNLTRGYGLVGGCTVDSLVHILPADFGPNH
jgi:hypothetical protein